ncbi:dipeptide epimerase [Devosia rhodophyticola]|uniref:Dipeptide epimerase n=1 Tax=Devosia rhodophyticola TaxID=3026423 RepID=A0ABY7YXZ6_9HYPH|nr:N-acetyl-D-Glu racemase DgcA [Devosia rhodophyticola]WDR06263.1 dipeptide epimerase [Devosia rhodophyticola]
MSGTALAVFAERFPIAGGFTISRGSKTEAEVVTVQLSQDGKTGWGECVPYARYGERIDQTIGAITALEMEIAGGLTRLQLQSRLPPGAARNGLDCAMWDLEAKLAGRSVADLLGRSTPAEIVTAFTISLDTPQRMAAAAAKAEQWSLLKLKLGGEGDIERLMAVRRAVPNKRIIVDANEAWSAHNLPENLDACQRTRIELVEQPLPADQDQILADIVSPVAICADESAHVGSGLARIEARYQAINIKLDKTGGLTEALALMAVARGQGMKVMLGCMVCTSLSIEPLTLLAADADWCDLDGPFLLERDRPGGFDCVDGRLVVDSGKLWGISS